MDEITLTKMTALPDADDTQPAVNLLKCPCCDGTGSELTGEEHAFGYRLRRQQCSVCSGLCFVARGVVEVWRRR